MRLIARFAQEQENCFEIITVYDLETIKESLPKVSPTLLSIVDNYPAADWFERKISDDFGIEILNGSNNKPLVKHESFPKDTFPLRKAFTSLSPKLHKVEKANYKEIGSITFGPTHPYHLDSYQFQFRERNENILEFNVKPFYKYRAIEKMVEGLTLDEARPMVERICGTTSIAFQVALLDIQLQASKRKLPSVIRERHIFLLEFERIINHLSDLAVMCQFISFEEGGFFLMKLLELAREEMKSLTGHRFGFGTINPHEIHIDLVESEAFLLYLEKEFIWFEGWIMTQKTFWQKLIYKGLLFKENSEKYGLVGIMARSVALKTDRREDDGSYAKRQFLMVTEETGDASARFKVRMREVLNSFSMMKNITSYKAMPFFLGTVMDGEYYAYVESSAGEVMMFMNIKKGKINRFYLREPSFLNAQVLGEAIKNNEPSDLGLIFKSIPLNFSANDL